jgi:hypothetical protein
MTINHAAPPSPNFLREITNTDITTTTVHCQDIWLLNIWKLAYVVEFELTLKP